MLMQQEISMRLSSLATMLGFLLAAPAFAQTAPQAIPTKPPASSPAPTGTAAAPSTMPTTAPSSSLIDINTATKDQLEALPQIGAARADAIIKGRPYRAKSDLIDKKIIPQNAYDAIREKIVARQKT
jgi:DNA uptake protein ComE-like DNA-binding protein